MRNIKRRNVLTHARVNFNQIGDEFASAWGGGGGVKF